MTRLRILVLATVAAMALPGCKRAAPKDFVAAGYTFTLPGRWSGEQQHKNGFEHIVFSAFDSDVACFAQVFPGHMAPEAYVGEILEGFKATDVEPVALQTAVGTFQGRKFVSNQTSKNIFAKIALAEGKPHGEIYAMRDGQTLVAMMLLTVGTPAKQTAAHQPCAAILASIRRGNEVTPAR